MSLLPLSSASIEPELEACFRDEYYAPTRFYELLQERALLNPYFLKRNLAYAKRRRAKASLRARRSAAAKSVRSHVPRRLRIVCEDFAGPALPALAKPTSYLAVCMLFEWLPPDEDDEDEEDGGSYLLIEGTRPFVIGSAAGVGAGSLGGFDAQFLTDLSRHPWSCREDDPDAAPAAIAVVYELPHNPKAITPAGVQTLEDLLGKACLQPSEDGISRMEAMETVPLAKSRKFANQKNKNWTTMRRLLSKPGAVGAVAIDLSWLFPSASMPRAMSAKDGAAAANIPAAAAAAAAAAAIAPATDISATAAAASKECPQAVLELSVRNFSGVWQRLSQQGWAQRLVMDGCRQLWGFLPPSPGTEITEIRDGGATAAAAAATATEPLHTLPEVLEEAAKAPEVTPVKCVTASGWYLVPRLPPSLLESIGNEDEEEEASLKRNSAPARPPLRLHFSWSVLGPPGADSLLEPPAEKTASGAAKSAKAAAASEGAAAAAAAAATADGSAADAEAAETPEADEAAAASANGGRRPAASASKAAAEAALAASALAAEPLPPALFLHFAYKAPDGAPVHRTEERENGAWHCPWCGPSLRAVSPATLLAHLRASHPHFMYRALVSEKKQVHIIAARDSSLHASPDALLDQRFQPFSLLGKRPPIPDIAAIAVGAGKPNPALPPPSIAANACPAGSLDHLNKKPKTTNGGADLAASVESMAFRFPATAAGSAASLATEEQWVPVRQYYHSRTCAPMLPEEAAFDSDEEIDDDWILALNENLLDEFEDVSLEEKAFMKLWNNHSHGHHAFADSHVAPSCELFARRFAATLVAEKLQHNFLLHLFNLWDLSLISNDHVSKCMAIVHEAGGQDGKGNTPPQGAEALPPLVIGWDPPDQPTMTPFVAGWGAMPMESDSEEDGKDKKELG